MASAGNITAVLTLNSSGFQKGLTESLSKVQNFSNSINKLGTSTGGLKALHGVLDGVVESLSRLDGVSKQNLNTLSRLSTSINKMANGLKILQSGTVDVDQGINTMNSIFKAFQGVLNGTEIKVKGVVSSFSQLSNAENQEVARQERMQQALANGRNSFVASEQALRQMGKALNQVSVEEEKASTSAKQLAVSEKEVVSSSNQASSSIQRQAGASDKATASTNRQATATRGLHKAMSSLRMMGTMVGSMIAYNFAHKLAMATTETIHAKSEMEGYFKMLHYSKDQVNDFNKSLDETVQLFPRLNKYSLGETISSIGVEFELTTEEMKKAMPVVSMITSEYLRAGRNVNEASLAVKDILQGEFQRLSRETGVKGDQLKEAGWSGDKNDVMGLLEALQKIGEDRNWDQFVTKANSLNDIILILQNRFGEWSADMVNVVQPAIVGAFNSILSFAEGLSRSLSGMWQWLNGGSWEATATKIGLLATAIYSVVTAFTSYRTGANLLELRNAGLLRTIYSVITGTKLEAMANLSVRDSIMAKLLGLKSEEVAENGLVASINASIMAKKLSTVEENVNTASRGLNTASIQSQMVGLTAESDAETLNTLAKQLNTGATEEASASTIGYTGALWMMIYGEKLAEGETLSLSGALGILTGAFLTSPVGWFALAILGLASAFYVLSGGLDESWDKMKQYNEVMKKNAQSSIKPYRDEVTRLEGEVEKATEKYGENSNEVKKLKEELDDAKGSLDSVNHSVQHGAYWNNEYKKSFEGIDAELDKITRNKLGDLGVSDEEIDKISELSDVINTGVDKQYHALQVLHKQQSNYGDGVDELSKKLDHAHIKGDEATESLAKFKGNTDNLITHSAIANSSDDWWEWLWNSFYAGMDQFWIDWDNFWLEVRDTFINWDFLSDEGKTNLKSITDFFGGIWDGLNSSLDDWSKGAVDFLKPLDDFGNEVNKFLNDPLGYLHIDLSGFDFIGKFFEDLFSGGNGGETGGFMKKIDIASWLKNLFKLGDSVDFSWATDFINNNIITPLSDAWNNFISNPMDALGGVVNATGIGGFISALLGSDGVDFSWAIEWVNTNIISPISQTLMMFVGDPVSFIGNLGFSVSGLLDGLFGTDIFTNIWNWTNTNIIAPIGNAIWSGISQIPIVGDIVALLGLLSNENIGAGEKGRAIANWIGNGITSAIGQIPIIGDIARMLGLIPQQEPNAQGKGKGIGDSIKDGVMNGLNNLGSQVIQEFNDALGGIGKLGEEAYNTAKGWADQLWQGVNSILQRHSPGFFHDQFQLEFGQDIPNAITEAGSTAYTVAQAYGQSIKDGISETSFNTVGFDNAVGIYQDDAQIVADSSQYMGTTTATAFNQMTTSVNQSTTQMQGNVATSYSSMQQKQQSSLNTMRNQNLQAYNDMYLKSNQSLIQMRDSTSNVTHQMTNAWTHMKDQIVASANKLKSDSTSHFNQLSNTIGGFYRKIQNPSNWGAGVPTRSSSARKPSTGRRIATRIASNHGAGINPYQDSKSISLRDLMRMTGVSDATKLDLNTFLASIWGEHGFGWDDWSSSHYSYIKSTSDNWNMKAPMIMGRIQAGNGYKVKEFENGTPHMTWDSFMTTAEAVFNAIPYKFYWDSNWKGDWVSAIKAGACNCSDGSEALIALAQTFGFDGYKQHTVTRGGLGHFYAVINGRKMDTTHFQNSGSWTPLGAGVPTRTANPSGGAFPQGNKTVNLTVNINEPVYGVDDLDSKIQESVQKGLQKEFNDPYTVAI